ncbi:MAG: hybrid sensor histidine kinase/response regulator [SAR324 cluster bacterium]|nr:hybrid sensor histidine kinase/response regulator [SAR324 cluster bacterium]
MAQKDIYRFFKIEARELLGTLNQGLISLETTPEDSNVLNKVFRAAHTMKGASRLVQLNTTGEISHHLESLLDHARTTPLSTAQIELCFEGLRGIDLIVTKLEKGENPETDVSEILRKFDPEHPAALEPALPANKTAEPAQSAVVGNSSGLNRDLSLKNQLPEPVKQQEPQPAEIIPAPVNQELKTPAMTEPAVQTDHNHSQTRETSAEEQTIRVDLTRLNTIMNLSGELIINKIRLENKTHTLHEIHKLARQASPMLQQWQNFVEAPELQQLIGKSGRVKEAVSQVNKGLNIQKQIQDKISEFAEVFKQDLKLTHSISQGLQDQAFKARMLPAESLFSGFGLMVRSLGRELGKEVVLEVLGGEIEVDKQILDDMKAPLIHIIRNAIDHGIEPPEERLALGKPPAGKIRLTLERQGSGFSIACEDDGRGIDHEKIRQTALHRKLKDKKQLEEMSPRDLLYLILAPGFSTAEILTSVSGRGIGMDVVASSVAQLKGNLIIETKIGSYARFIIQFPRSLMNLPCLFLESGGENMLVPLSAIAKILRITLDDIETEGNQEVINYDGQVIPLIPLNHLMNLPGRKTANRKRPVVVVHSRGERVAFAIEKLLGIKEVIVKNLGNHIKKIPNVSGATILGNGFPVLILDPSEMIRNSHGVSPQSTEPTEQIEAKVIHQILIVDDSLTTRMMEKTILESAGYKVDLAVSGEDALEKVEQTSYQLLVVDVEMPGINGFELTKKLKASQTYSGVPVIIVSSLASPEMKRKGIDSGANAYIVKGEFDQAVLLDTIQSLIT